MTEPIEIISTLVALVGMFLGLREYRLNNRNKRMEAFFSLRSAIYQRPTLKEIATLIENDDVGVRYVGIVDRYEYAGWFEEVAIMVEKHFITVELAHYMFGHYTLACWRNEHFWHDIDRNSPYWTVLANFAELMKKQETILSSLRRQSVISSL